MFVGGTKPKLSSWNCCKKCKMCSSVSPAYRNVALQTQKGHLQYEMFHIHGTRWVQAGSRLHRTVSRQVLFVNREVLDFFVGPLVPCATTSPSLGLTKYASAYGLCAQGQARQGGRREMYEGPSLFLLPVSRQRVSLFPVSRGDFHPHLLTLCILLSMR